MIAIGPEKYSTAEAQDKGFKLAVMNMFKNLKEDMGESLNEVCKKHTQWNETKKTFQDMKAEFNKEMEFLKKNPN